MIRHFWSVLFLCFGFSVVGSAQEPSGRVPVEVVAKTPNALGERLAFHVREGIRRSAGLELVPSPNPWVVTVKILTLDPKCPEEGAQSVFTVLWLLNLPESQPILIDAHLGVSGSTPIGEVAETLVAQTDSYVGYVGRIMADSIKRRSK